jgi:UDP-2-acetamido-3-amino-2,3-dideoxy-glucuronate N-acetyltransferase
MAFEFDEQAASTRIAVIGSGHWGKNLVRNFHNLGFLAKVCDLNPDALEQVRQQYAMRSSTASTSTWKNPSPPAPSRH